MIHLHRWQTVYCSCDSKLHLHIHRIHHFYCSLSHLRNINRSIYESYFAVQISNWRLYSCSCHFLHANPMIITSTTPHHFFSNNLKLNLRTIPTILRRTKGKVYRWISSTFSRNKANRIPHVNDFEHCYLYRCTVHSVVYLINTPTNAHI